MKFLLVTSLFIKFSFFGLFLEDVNTNSTPYPHAGKSCAEKFTCTAGNEAVGRRHLPIETENVLQLCDSTWGFGQMYRRFEKLMHDPNYHSIGIFLNARINYLGINEAVADLHRNSTWNPKDYGAKKSIRLYGIIEHKRSR